MNNKEKYNAVFIDSFNLKQEDLDQNVSYGSITEWDSVGHMGMIAELEDIFSIEFETDDIVDFSDFKKGISILKKYGVDI